MKIEVTGQAILRVGNQPVTIDTEMLERSSGVGDERGMGADIHHVFTYTDDLGRTAEWTISEYPIGVVNNVTFHSHDYTVMNNFKFEYEHRPDDDYFIEEYKETSIDKMTNWFHANYQDPVNRLPYNSREGGYQYLYGGPYDANEEISDNYSHQFPEVFIEEAVDRVQAGGIYDWDKAEEPGDYGEDEPPEDMEDPFPSPKSLTPPEQNAGPRWQYINGKISPKYKTVNPDPICNVLHVALRNAAREAKQKCTTLGNKFPDLWATLLSYVNVIDVEHSDVVEISAYVNGLDLASRFRTTREFSEKENNEHPELGLVEISAIKKVIQLHAPYIQTTELGRQITELAERENRTPQQTRQLATEIVEATEALLEYPELVDSAGVELLRDTVSVDDSDPKFYRRVTLSQVGIRNLCIVIGTLAVVYIAPPAIGAAAGLLLANTTAAVGNVAGAAIGAAIGSQVQPWLRPAIMDTEPFKAVKQATTNSLNTIFNVERPRFKAILSMYTKIRDKLFPVVSAPGIDEWFESLDRDLERAGFSNRKSLKPSSKNSTDRTERTKQTGYIGYSNTDWEVDAAGMIALNGSHKLTVSEIFSITKWEKTNPVSSIDVYHMLLHFSLKSRINLDNFIDGWKNAVEAHAPLTSRQINSEVLDDTIRELKETGSLSSKAQNSLNSLAKTQLKTANKTEYGDDSPF